MKTILYMAMSVDGFIADKNDDAPWSNTIWQAYLDTVSKAGNIIIGRRTYEIMNSAGDFTEFAARPETTIVSSDPSLPLSNELDRVAGSPEEAIKSYGQNHDVLLVGGGAITAQSFLSLGLIDEIHLDIDPLILGKGIPFIKDIETLQLRRKLLSELEEGVIHVEYEVVK